MTSVRSLVACALCFFSVLLPMAAGGSPPAEKPESIEEREFVPHAGYVRTTKLLNWARSIGPMAAPSAVTALSGKRRIPVVLLRFKNTKDESMPFKDADYRNLLFGPKLGDPIRLTMTQYYRDVSYGKLEVEGDVFGWYTLPEDDTYYENGGNGKGKPFGDLLEAGLRKLDGAADLGVYDNDGPDGIANSGDDDGKVDTVFFIHPEAGAECGKLSLTSNIWSHSWNYSQPSLGRGVAFESKDVQRDEAPSGQKPGSGPAKLKSNGSEAHILVDDYTIQPGLSCKSSDQNKQMIEIGVFCHEYGHALGLPDLYDRTPKNPDSAGVGFWCLMSSGSYGGDGLNHSEEPVHLSPWCKQFLGWASVAPLEERGTFPFEPVEADGRMYRVDVPGTEEKEYFLVELRDREWSDPTGKRHNWDRGLPASGLAIWHVDERVGAGEPSWPFTPPGKGQNDWPSRPKAEKHALVALMQADRRQDLEKSHGRGDSEDVWFTGKEFGDDQELFAGTRGYDGKATGITLTHLDFDHQKFDFQLPVQIAAMAAPVAPATASPAVEVTIASTSPMSAAPGADDSAEAGQTETEGDLPSRTTILTRQSEGTTQVERQVVELLKESESRKTQVQIAPEGDRVERITGLNLPAEKQSVQEDAKHRVKHELSHLLGGVELKLRQSSVEDIGWNKQVFEQFIQKLPIFGAKATLFYDHARRLAAVTAATWPERQVHVTGKVGELSVDEAKSLVRNMLGLAGSVLTSAREGVFLVSGEPESGRVAYEVRVAAGEGQQDIRVYVDSETHKILSIQ